MTDLPARHLISLGRQSNIEFRKVNEEYRHDMEVQYVSVSSGHTLLKWRCGNRLLGI